MVTFIESVTTEAILKYGERAKVVLKAALDIAKEMKKGKRNVPGDFDIKMLNRKLREYGFNYNPSQLLRILERDYGIIETTYRSTNQRWWKFIDIESVEKALRSFYPMSEDDEGLLDPEIALLEIQTEIIDIDRIIGEIDSLLSKPQLTSIDKSKLKQIVFDELPMVTKVLKNTLRYENHFAEFNRKAISLIWKVRNIVVHSKRKDLERSLVSLAVEKLVDRGKP